MASSPDRYDGEATAADRSYNNEEKGSADRNKASSRKKGSRKRSRSYGSRSRSRSRGNKSYSRSPRRSRSRSRSRTFSPGQEGTRVHIANIDDAITEHDIEDAFGRFGPVLEIWLATYAPFYAFLVYKDRADAEDAIRYLNGTYLRNSKLRVSLALPRRRYKGARVGGGGPPAPRYGGYRSGGYRGNWGYRGGGGYRGDYYGDYGGRGRSRSRSPYGRRYSRSPPRRSRRSRSRSSGSSRSR